MDDIVEFEVFRQHVDELPCNSDAVLLKTLYLTASRVYEVVTKRMPNEAVKGLTSYGERMDWSLVDYVGDGVPEKVLLLRIAVAKRKTKGKDDQVYKMIALPCSPKYEPWTVDLLKHIQERGRLAFDLTTRRVGQIVKRTFRDLDTMIHTHSLRHFRITHLVNAYGFEPYDLTAIAGWTYRTGLGHMGLGSGKLDAYLHLAWKHYFPKLLKPMHNLMGVTRYAVASTIA